MIYGWVGGVYFYLFCLVWLLTEMASVCSVGYGENVAKGWSECSEKVG